MQRQKQETATLKAEVGALQKQVRHLAELSLRVEELRGELRRLGGDAPRPRRRPAARPVEVTAVKGGMRIKLPRATVLQRAGAKPDKRPLSGHLKEFNGFVLAYWATWCKPCIADRELERVRTLRRALRAKNVELISMAIDDLADVRNHPKADRWIYPLWQKDDGHVEMLPRLFVETVGLGLPLFVVANAQGEIRHYLKSDLQGDAMDQLVAAASAL